ncbi:MAG: hypothetical protein QG568_736 [Patescibacteria group bacterium]|nr:hypothetical protein [Patescibacteria group bacterium]
MKKNQKEYLINGIDPYDFKRETYLGVNIYSRSVPWASCIYVRFLFNCGALNDPAGKEGVTHFMEHMLFTGTPIYPTKFDIDQFSKLYTLDSLNAFTSFQHMCLNYRCLSYHFEESIKGSIEMLTKSFLNDESVEKEKKIITQEAWGVYKNTNRIKYIKSEQKNIFKDFPDRLRISSSLGWPNTISKIERRDIVHMYQTNLVRENLTVIINGQISPKHKKVLKEYLSKIPSGQKAKEVYIPKSISTPKNRIWIHTYEEMGLTPSNQAYIGISGAIPKHNFAHNKEIGALTRALLYEILFQELRHKNSWCYGVKASFGVTEDYAFGELSSNIDPAYIHEALEIIERIISNILKGEYQKEFEQEKSLYIDRKKAAEVTTEDITHTAVHGIRYHNQIQKRKDSFKNIQSVAFSDIQFLVKGVFVDSKTKIFEIHVPNGYNKENTQKFLKNTYFK